MVSSFSVLPYIKEEPKAKATKPVAIKQEPQAVPQAAVREEPTLLEEPSTHSEPPSQYDSIGALYLSPLPQPVDPGFTVVDLAIAAIAGLALGTLVGACASSLFSAV